MYAHPEFLTAAPHASRWMRRYGICLSHVRRLTQKGEPSGSLVGVVQDLLETILGLETRHTQGYMMLKDAWLNGDVEDGCTAHARLQMLVFGDTEDDMQRRATELEDAVSMVSRSAGIPIRFESLGEPYMGVRPNQSLVQAVQEAISLAGLNPVVDPPPLLFATEFGNMTHHIPGALIGVGRQSGWRFHTSQGAAEFNTKDAERLMLWIADVLPFATMLLFKDSSLMGRIRDEHAERTG